MRRVFENDIKNRITNVTEYSLKRDGVHKNTYAAEFTNTKLVEMNSGTEDMLNNTIGNSVEAIANSMVSSNFASEFNPILCNSTEVLGNLTLKTPTFIEYALLKIYTGYSVGTVIDIYIDADTDDAKTNVATITIDDTNASEYNINIGMTIINVNNENPITIKANISGNTNENATAVLSYKYHAIV